MPDILDFVVTDLADANVTVNRFRIDFRICQSNSGQATVSSHSLTWPNVFGTLTAAQKKRVYEVAIREIVRIKIEEAGI